MRAIGELARGNAERRSGHDLVALCKRRLVGGCLAHGEGRTSGLRSRDQGRANLAIITTSYMGGWPFTPKGVALERWLVRVFLAPRAGHAQWRARRAAEVEDEALILPCVSLKSGSPSNHLIALLF